VRPAAQRASAPPRQTGVAARAHDGAGALGGEHEGGRVRRAGVGVDDPGRELARLPALGAPRERSADAAVPAAHGEAEAARLGEHRRVGAAPELDAVAVALLLDGERQGVMGHARIPGLVLDVEDVQAAAPALEISRHAACT
jgi:hypothetical protein